MGSNKKAELRREKFAIKFWETINGRESAIYAGVKDGPGLDVQVSRLLSDDKVQAKLRKLREKQEKRTIISKDRVLQELAFVGFADMKDYLEVVEGGIVHIKPWKELPDGATRAVSKVKEKKSILASGEGDGEGVVIDNSVEFAHHDKVKALTEIAALQGYYPTKQIELTGNYENWLKILKAAGEKV